MTAFSEAMAARVIELERELANAKRDLARVRQSREMWKARYKTAALAARKMQAAVVVRRIEPSRRAVAMRNPLFGRSARA